tara:strand:+ start:588 stop:1277 length:690 start_codon:yes stop_codon:yes gene_type:complete
MSLTLAVTGVFLYRDYASFLKGAYVKHGKVVSIQAAFSSHVVANNSPSRSFVPEGFYPIIEYMYEGQAVRFTALDHLASAKLHVGDNIQLRIITTRRKENRACKSLIALVSLISIFGITLFAAAITGNAPLSLAQICLGSLIIALSLTILALYFSDQDQRFMHDLKETKRGYTQLALAEPTAYKKWQSSFRDPVQRFKIQGSRCCGATFIGSAMVVLGSTFSPYLLSSV